MKFMCYDTETGGIPNWKSPSNSPEQPHMVSVGAVLTDAHGVELRRLYNIVRPDGWEIDPETIKIHGITMERAMDEGIPEGEALHNLLAMNAEADVRVGYNEMFDRRIARIALYRHGRPREDYGHGWAGAICMPDDPGMREQLSDWWNYGVPDYDVMKGIKEAAGWPKQKKLGESYTYVFEREMPNAHSAIDDAHHTRELFQWLLEHGHARFDAEWFKAKNDYKESKAREKIAARKDYTPVGG